MQSYEPANNAQQGLLAQSIVADWNTINNNTPKKLRVGMTVVRWVFFGLSMTMLLLWLLVLLGSFAGGAASEILELFGITKALMLDSLFVSLAVWMGVFSLLSAMHSIPTTLYALSSMSKFIVSNNIGVDEILIDANRCKYTYAKDSKFVPMVASYEMLLIMTAAKIKSEQMASKLKSLIVLHIITQVLVNISLIILLYFFTSIPNSGISVAALLPLFPALIAEFVLSLVYNSKSKNYVTDLWRFVDETAFAAPKAVNASVGLGADGAANAVPPSDTQSNTVSNGSDTEFSK